MKRKITLEFVLMISVSLIIFIFGATLIARTNINKVTELNLEHYLEIVKTEYESGKSEEEVVAKYQNIDDYLRITFMDPTGVVVADSLADELDNHLNRPEFNDLGTIYIRHSKTLDIEMMYLAYEFDNGMFVRVSIPIRSILPFLNDFIGLSIVVGVIIITLTIISSNILIKWSLQPLIDIKSNLRDVNNGQYSQIVPVKKYNEINDLIREINDINKNISSNIASLKSEKQKNDFLLNHMDQGICVLDKEGKIIMLNQFLRDLYKFNIDINLNKDYRFLFRDSEIQNAINKAYEKGINTNTVIRIEEDYYSVMITFLEENWMNQPSVILIFSDVTALKNIETVKRDFFINASHELKSPLTSILGFSEIISQGMTDDNNTASDLAGKISEEAKRMNNLVMDMLALSQYENQAKGSQKKDVNIKTILHEVIAGLKLQAKKEDIKLHYEERDIYIHANYEEIYQIFKNLIENSIRYGNKSGNIWINVEHDKTELMIKVADDGIGISKAAQARIFERFYRVDKARSRLTGGTGLGLSIVKHIVLNYNGHIELDSTEGKGTTITIFIPNDSIKLI